MRSMTEILRAAEERPTRENTATPVVRLRQVQPQQQQVQFHPIHSAAYFLEILKYGDMMEVATELHALKADNPLASPEDIAKLLHQWAVGKKEQFLSQNQASSHADNS